MLSPLRGFFAAALLIAWALAVSPLAAEEPPGAWFLNAHGTGSDYVYFSVGGDASSPPRGSREVLLGWSWNEAGTPVERYPGSVPARYRPSRLSGKQPWQWVADAGRIGAPRLGIGPGRELLLLGHNEGSTALAMRWAELLDSIEAAYRHSSPDLAASERREVVEIGRIGHCGIRSVPVEGTGRGWSSLQLAGHARPSRSGGYYYVDRRFDAARERRRPVEIQRFQRFVDGDDCGGYGMDLSLFPAPREEAFEPPYFVVWSGLELPNLDFVDLEPTPRTASVRTLTRFPGTQREEINIATWPPATVQGMDLCDAPFMETLCLKDLRIREQLATSATSDPAVSGPLIDGCRHFFDPHGFDQHGFSQLGNVPSPHPCTDPRAWRQSIGTYRTGYTGEIVLREQPRLVSRVDSAGDVQWLWSGTPDASRETRFPLPDGTQIALGMPRTAPPTLATPRPPAQPVPAPTPPPVPAAALSLAQAPDPPSSAIEARPLVTESRVSTTPTPGPDTVNGPDPETGSGTAAGSGAATAIAPKPPAGTGTGTHPRAGTATADVTTPGESIASGATSSTASAPTTPPPDATTEPASQHPQPATDASTEPAGIDTASPISALSQQLMWPIALALLAMTIFVALLLRGQRTSARTRRQALTSGLVAEEPAPVLLLEADSHGERLLAGRDVAESHPDSLLLEAPTEPAADVETPEAEAPETEPRAETDLESETPPGALEPPAEQSESPTAELELPATLEPPLVVPIARPEPISAAAVLQLDPPSLSAAPPAIPPETREPDDSPWHRWTQERDALEIHERQGIDKSLTAVSNLGDWVSCLLPVLDNIEQGRGKISALDRLPAPAQQEWREATRTLREFADNDLVVCHHLSQELSHSSRALVENGEGPETECLADSGLLDPERGTLPQRLRRHLLEPGAGRLQGLVLSLQYLIEALPVEHMEKPERRAYLSAIRQRLQDKGLSTKFHQLVDDLASGLGLRYRQTRYYKVRLDDPGFDALREDHDTVDLSRRIGYTAGTEDNVVVRLSELFLTDAANQERYSGRALIDRGS